MPDDDPLREMRTMILLSLPFPPIPVQVSKVEDGIIQQTDSVITTHDILAVCLNSAAARGDQIHNHERRTRQRQVLQRFLHAMATQGFTGTIEDLYHLYCEYSLLHVSTYFPDSSRPPEVIFMPFSYTSKNDPVHKQMCQYMAGQSLMFEDDPPLTSEYYAQLEYSSLLQICRARIGRTVTDEDRRLIEDA